MTCTTLLLQCSQAQVTGHCPLSAIMVLSFDIQKPGCIANLHLFSDKFPGQGTDNPLLGSVQKSSDDLEQLGIQPRLQMDSKLFAMHEPHPECVQLPQHAQWPEYSDQWYLLRRSQWFSITVTTDFSGGQLLRSTEKPDLYFHGTEWGSAFKILAKSEGFVVGPSVCGGRSGLWLDP